MPTPSIASTKRVLRWTNPLQDIAFVTSVDGTLDKYKNLDYGKTYQEIIGIDNQYKNYKLCNKSPDGNDGCILLLFVCDFKDQHLYNGEYVQVGTLKWPIVRQTFFIAREDWTGLNHQVSPPPSKGETWVRLRSYEERAPADLDGLFVVFSVEWQNHSYEYPEYVIDEQYGISTRKVTSIVDSESVPDGFGANQSYIGNGFSIRETYDLDTESMDSYIKSFYYELSPSVLNLPDVLESVTVQWNESEGSGAFSSDWNGAASGASYSLSGSESGSAEGSASVVPEITFNILQYYVSKLDASRYFFFLPIVSNEITDAQILAKLPPGVVKWPVFKPKSHMISLKGGSISVQARASASAGASWSSSTSSQELTEGEGGSQSRSVTHNSRNIPPTIHGTISFGSGASRTVTASADASVGWTGSGSPVPLPSANAQYSIEQSITGSVFPTSLPATSPSSIPTSGLYWVKTNIVNWKYNYVMVEAIVFDASQLA